MSRKILGKSTEVEAGPMKVFGVEVFSRYGRANEIVEMINFMEVAAKLGHHRYVKKLYYESKINACQIELDESLGLFHPVSMMLFQVASQTISQFVWFDIHEEGTPFPRQLDKDQFVDGFNREQRRLKERNISPQMM